MVLVKGNGEEKDDFFSPHFQRLVGLSRNLPQPNSCQGYIRRSMLSTFACVQPVKLRSVTREGGSMEMQVDLQEETSHNT